MIKKLKNRQGFVSIETILAVSVAMMVILVLIGFFTTIFPRVRLQMETHTLAQKAKIQGGLTDATSQSVDSDVEIFKEKLSKVGYRKEDIQITAYTEPGNLSAIGVTPYDSEGSNYIKRGSGETIYIVVKVPANQSIKAPLSFFGLADSAIKEYIIVETVMSERW